MHNGFLSDLALRETFLNPLPLQRMSALNQEHRHAGTVEDGFSS